MVLSLVYDVPFLDHRGERETRRERERTRKKER